MPPVPERQAPTKLSLCPEPSVLPTSSHLPVPVPWDLYRYEAKRAVFAQLPTRSGPSQSTLAANTSLASSRGATSFGARSPGVVDTTTLATSPGPRMRPWTASLQQAMRTFRVDSGNPQGIARRSVSEVGVPRVSRDLSRRDGGNEGGGEAGLLTWAILTLGISRRGMEARSHGGGSFGV